MKSGKVKLIIILLVLVLAIELVLFFMARRGAEQGLWGKEPGYMTAEDIGEVVTNETLDNLEIVKSGWSLRDSSDDLILYFGLVVKNLDTQYSCRGATVRITARDEQDRIVGTSDVRIYSLIAPGSVGATGGYGFELSKVPAKVTFEVVTSYEEWIDGVLPEMTTSDVVMERQVQYEFTRVTGMVHNDTDRDFGDMRVVIIFLDKDGNVIVGDETWISELARGESIEFSSYTYGFLDPASCETYVMPTVY